MRSVHRKTLTAAALAAITLVGFGASRVHAAAELFTTQDDFSGWESNGNASETLAAQATPDSDGSAINGLGNTDLGPGNAGAPGSLDVTQAGGTYNFFYSQGEQGNFGFLNAINAGPLSVAGSTNLTGGTTTVSIDFTTPPNVGGSYFELGVVLNYSGNFGQFFGGTAVNDGNGFSTLQIPITVNPVVGLSYFQFGLIFNSNYDSSGPTSFAVDNITSPVPEPASLGVLALGGLTMLRRRRR